MNEPSNIETASVKVMRSHDYCHFEVCLSSSSITETKDVDELRKAAARLADKAVEQYKVMKAEALRQLESEQNRKYLLARIAETESIPEQDRTIRQQAELKAFKDEPYKARDRYDYEDVWEDWDHQQNQKNHE